MQKTTKRLLILSIIIMFAVNFQNVSSSIETSSLNNQYAKIAYELYKNEPTNPTQILKNQYLAKNGIIKLENEVLSDPIIQDNLNDENTFWIIGTFTSYPYNYVQKTAKLLAIGDHSYVYVLSSLISLYGESAARTKAELWRDEFENRIFPNDVFYFGNPDGYKGDIDGDPHVTILLADLDGGVAGYFDPINEDPGVNSNQREMVYVDYSSTYGVLAHEFQHLIHFNYDPYEFWFVDEGCAEFAKYLSGYDVLNNLTTFARDYFALNPDDSLLYWNYQSEGGKDVRIDYGGAYLFIFYLAEKFGVLAIKDLVADVTSGAAGVEDAIQATGSTLTFNEFYLNWITALAIDDTSFDNGTYGYINLNINIDHTLVSVFPAYKTGKLHRFYGIHVAKLMNPPDYLFYEITSPSQYNLGYSIAIHDVNGWKIKQNLKSTAISDFLNGTVVDTAYVITSIMSSSTPSISYNDQFGLGYSENLDYSFVPGSPLIFNSYSYLYDEESWLLELENIQIVDENGTEITNSSGINVFAQFTIKGTSILYNYLPLNYSISKLWYLNSSLQSFDENQYDLAVVASGSEQYGELYLDAITVIHILNVEKPVVQLFL
ncbi:MAG: hypothetical protein ACTSP3_09330 [Candidatus Heimdallarchaeaceae archaeon]